MSYLFTSESVSEGHPDKLADQISDAILDNFLAFDSASKVACETLVTTGQVVIAGEVKTTTYLDLQQIVRDTITKVGYTKSDYMFEANSCGILSAIHEQSNDINQGVERSNPEDQGAGDQGIMFGYAVNETKEYMPLALYLSHLILKELATIRKEGVDMPYLRPDAKSQVTIEYSDEGKPLRIDTIVISTQHDRFVNNGNKHEDELAMQGKIQSDIIRLLMPRVLSQLSEENRLLFQDDLIYHINPTGVFVIGGPHGDTGLTGRKIIVDTYGGKGGHGGGAFSGKDPSKVDRSAAYAARHMAKNAVAAGICDEMLVQISYAIGRAEPTSIYVDTYGTSHVSMSDIEIGKILNGLFDMRPYFIEERLKLRNPIYSETASYGHMGRKPETVEKVFKRQEGGKEISKTMKVELFTWEKLDMVDKIKDHFNIS